ncbi:MAG: protein-methionine-sulfoxide reductase heme-binding subunit MsrQ [Gammaproteobacteria bacterium]
MRHLIQFGKPILFIVALLPLGRLIGWAVNDGLGANPVETITRYTGDWTLRFLLITLAVTPLRQLTGWNWLQRFRRMLGLFAFFYVCLHFTTFLVFDHFFDLQGIMEDIVKRPYITVGFTAFVLLIPLAVTSTNAMMKRLGRRWQKLHRLVYGIAVLGVLHYLWLVKADISEPLIYGTMLALLLAYRYWHYSRRRVVVGRSRQQAQAI